VRDYTPVASDSVASAGHLVAQFPDSATARRAYAVLTAWHDRCADRISQHKTHRVGDLQSVDVGPSAIGDWYLLTYGPVPHYPQDGYFDAQGMTLVGHRIAMLEMVLTGQDYNYRRGHEPMVAAVKAAAAKLR
jgi:hypothetical protein